jgi:hypothetical protein
MEFLQAGIGERSIGKHRPVGRKKTCLPGKKPATDESSEAALAKLLAHLQDSSLLGKAPTP